MAVAPLPCELQERVIKFYRSHPCFEAALVLVPQGEAIKLQQPQIQAEGTESFIYFFFKEISSVNGFELSDLIGF